MVAGVCIHMTPAPRLLQHHTRKKEVMPLVLLSSIVVCQQCSMCCFHSYTKQACVFGKHAQVVPMTLLDWSRKCDGASKSFMIIQCLYLGRVVTNNDESQGLCIAT